MKTTLNSISGYQLNVSNIPAYELVYDPVITASVDDVAAATELTISINIDGTIFYTIYSDTDTRPSTAEEVKTDSEAMSIVASADIDEVVDISALSLTAGTYYASISAHNDYLDFSALTEIQFEVV